MKTEKRKREREREKKKLKHLERLDRTKQIRERKRLKTIFLKKNEYFFEGKTG